MLIMPSMPLILSHKSALDFYRLSDEEFVASLPRVRDVRAFSHTAPDSSCLAKLASLRLEPPISVINNSSARLRNTHQFEYRRFIAAPSRSYLKLGDGLYVCSPELVFFSSLV